MDNRKPSRVSALYLGSKSSYQRSLKQKTDAAYQKVTFPWLYSISLYFTEFTPFLS
jgi:hypothetical protein